jgi:hypothetical protein
MSFSEVQQSVQQAWDFTWPPVVLLFLMVALVRFLAPVTFSATWGRLLSEAPPGWTRVRVFFHRLGVSKLLPVAFLFLIVFTLFLTNSAVHLVGNVIPPRISYRPDVVFARIIDEKRLACLWSFVPWSDFRDLQSIVSKRVHAEEKIDEGVKHWSEERDTAYRRFDAAKFLAAWALFWGLWETRIASLRRLRLPFVVIVLVAGATLYFHGFRYALQQLQFAEKDAAIALWVNRKSCLDDSGNPLTLTAAQKDQWLSIRKRSPGWEAQLPFQDYWRWFQ